MIRRFIFLLVICIAAACTTQSAQEATPYDFVSPLPAAPLTGAEFVESDIELVWNWKSLEPDQIFVLRLWFEDQEPHEVWLEETRMNVQEIIDGMSQEVGNFHWKVAVINRNADGGFASMASDWSAITTMKRVRRLSLEPVPVSMQSDMAQFVRSQALASDFELFDFLRDFVHNNTQITRQLSYEADYADAMQMVFDYYQGNGEAPQLYCDGMSTGMLTVLREMGYESRLNYLYGQATGYIGQHTTLEIFNRETQRWEVHDPTFNLYFIDTQTGERASMERLLFGDLDTISGCDGNGDCSHQKLGDSIEQYLGAVRYGYTPEIWVNPNRLDVSRRVTGLENNNFPEFIARMTGFQQRALIFRFDTWESMTNSE